LAAELVRRRVALIYTISNANAAQAAKGATATIPIVFTVGPDPVALGLVPSFNRPGGNVTGITYYGPALAPKRLELLRELVPEASTVAFLVNPANSSTEGAIADMKVAAGSVGQQIIVVSASTMDEIDSAFAAAARQGAGTFLVGNDGLFTAHRAQLVALAARYRIPASYFNRGFAEAGGLMSYADDRSESLREAASYIGRILKGEKPSDLPVLQPTKFDLAINVKTAKSLGLTFPPSFYLRADEVIE
jgi:putative ABC transport system substrate-binding protein